tara:strand:+ start:432 stop:653 length:222 start_codon:yes stop_codon:yes gene_type:complete
VPLPRKGNNMSKFINVEPDWNNMFNVAISITNTQIDKNNGQKFVVEMLKYGQRLYLQDKKNKTSKKRPITDLL